MSVFFQTRRGVKSANTHCLPPAEILLWERIRDYRLRGASFERDSIIGNDVADFACLDLRIAIMLDRETKQGNGKRLARVYEAAFANMGYIKIPVRSSEVYDNIDAVHARIASSIDKRKRKGAIASIA
jgi:very-short-patch-repair endonuclease